MSNIIAPADAETVSFSPPVRDNESREPYRPREAVADVLEEGRIAGEVEVPLPDEEFRPGMSQDEALKQLDPIIAEKIEETRLPDEVVFDGQRQEADEGFESAFR